MDNTTYGVLSQKDSMKFKKNHQSIQQSFLKVKSYYDHIYSFLMRNDCILFLRVRSARFLMFEKSPIQRKTQCQILHSFLGKERPTKLCNVYR